MESNPRFVLRVVLHHDGPLGVAVGGVLDNLLKVLAGVPTLGADVSFHWGPPEGIRLFSFPNPGTLTRFVNNVAIFRDVISGKDIPDSVYEHFVSIERLIRREGRP